MTTQSLESSFEPLDLSHTSDSWAWPSKGPDTWIFIHNLDHREKTGNDRKTDGHRFPITWSTNCEMEFGATKQTDRSPFLSIRRLSF
jgi:hypothetical protein